MWEIAGLFIGVTIISIIIYGRWNYGHLEKLGIPVPPETGSFLYGNTGNMHNEILEHQDVENGKKYGKLWGIYEGRRPVIMVADPALIRQIFVKDFSHFYNRRSQGFGDPVIDEAMNVAHGAKWKTVRTHISPAFRLSRMRIMNELMKDTIKNFIGSLERRASSGLSMEFNIRQLFASLTVDILARCAFGVRINSLEDERNAFIENVKRIFPDDIQPNFLTTLIVCYPVLSHAVRFFDQSAIGYLVTLLRSMLAQRKESGFKVGDFLEILQDAMDRIPSPEFQSVPITERTVLSQGVLFIFAGYDTSSITMTALAYLLATHPDIQEKVHAELNTLDEKSDSFKDCTYLKACMLEAMRMYPVIPRLERECTKDWTSSEEGGDGGGSLRLRKGDLVLVPLWALHRNPEYFKDPDKFVPDRFLGKGSPYSSNVYLPFGNGPRNCIGLRFAEDQILLAFAHVLRRFRIVATEKSKLELRNGMVFISTFKPVHLKLEMRM